MSEDDPSARPTGGLFAAVFVGVVGAVVSLFMLWLVIGMVFLKLGQEFGTPFLFWGPPVILSSLAYITGRYLRLFADSRHRRWKIILGTPSTWLILLAGCLLLGPNSRMGRGEGRFFLLLGALWFLPGYFFTWLAFGRGIAPPGHCRECGYDLTGNVSGRCPECGTSTGSRPPPSVRDAGL